MKKWIRVLVCLFGVVLISTLVLAQQQKPKLIEYVLSAGGFDPDNGYRYVPSNQAFNENFDSGPLLTVHVSPSPSSNAVFIEFSGQYWWWWGSGSRRVIMASIVVTAQSPEIPAGISIFTGGAGMEMGDINIAGPSFLRNRFTRISKIRMERTTYLTSWTQGFDVVYTADNEKVPEGTSVQIINRLIEKGFDLVFSVRGYVAGVSEIINTSITAEITRLAK
jgi:hypothetical protein